MSEDGLPCQLDTPTLSPAGLSGHTPGPWVVRESHPNEGFNCFWIEQPSGASIGTADGYQHQPEQRANARLIAAAPDMLEVLQHIVDGERFLYSEANVNLVVTLARLAIAKATSGPAQVPGDSSREDHSKAEASQS